MTEDLYIPDSLFSSDNAFEIPSLLIEKQAKYCQIPFVRYGEQKKTFRMNHTGTLHFYTDDYKFNTIFDHPELILKYQPAQIVEPNYSLYLDTPIAFGMQQVYKKRFLARAMQEKGLDVFVDLNVAPKFYKLNLLGVPMGWSAFCTRGYSDRLHQLEFEHQMAKAIARGNKLLFVVYAGGEEVRRYCELNGLVYVTPTVKIKDKLNAMKALEDSIAFLDMPSVGELLERKAVELFGNQVEDFGKMLGE